LRRRLPVVWLFTDERLGESLWAVLGRLPRGAGVILRHHAAPDRAAIGVRLRTATNRRGQLLLVADDARLARALRADGLHLSRAARGRRAQGVCTMTAHSVTELLVAERGGADLAFVSPVFPTRTHPGAPALGRVRFGLLTRSACIPIAALGGVAPASARSLRALGAYGWGAIDAHC